MIVHALTVGPIHTNCYIAVCEQTRRAAVIDPGWNAPYILAAVESLPARLDLILLTHAHFDHIGAVADVVDATQASVAMHPLDLPLLRVDGGARMAFIPIRSAPEPEASLEHGQVLEVGTLRFETRFAPGHTPGHVVFYVENEKVVFGGDVLSQGSGIQSTLGSIPIDVAATGQRTQGVVFAGDTLFRGSIGRTDFPGGDFDTLIGSIRGQLLTLPDDVVVCPGHGPCTTIGDERLTNPFL